MQFPAQTGEYKIKVKGASKWKEHDTAAFDISVGMPNHEGEKFASSMEWAKHRFKHVVINCNDSLQRFNFMFEDSLSEEEALEKSIIAGDAWIERNLKHLSGVDYSIERWEDWRNRANFKSLLGLVKRLYTSNEQFRSDIDKQIDTMWQRKYANDKGNSHRKLEFAYFSKEYLLEETAIFSMMASEKKQVHIYPGSFMQIWKSFDGTNIVPGLGAFQYTRIDFSRNKCHL